MVQDRAESALEQKIVYQEKYVKLVETMDGKEAAKEALLVLYRSVVSWLVNYLFDNVLGPIRDNDFYIW